MSQSITTENLTSHVKQSLIEYERSVIEYERSVKYINDEVKSCLNKTPKKYDHGCEFILNWHRSMDKLNENK